MTTLNLATSMGTNLLYAIKGDSNQDNLDYTASLDSSVTTTDGFTGRGVCLSSDKWVMGLSAATSIPYFLYAGLDANNAPDVLRSRGMAYSGAGKAVAWSVFSPLEILTTGFRAADTFTVGVPLTVSAAASAAGSKGLICTLGAATDTVIGYVGPKGKFTNEHGYDVVHIQLNYVRGTTLRTL